MDTIESTQHYKNIGVDNGHSTDNSGNICSNGLIWQIVKTSSKANVSFDITILAVGFFSEVKKPFNQNFFKFESILVDLEVNGKNVMFLFRSWIERLQKLILRYTNYTTDI